VRFPPRQRSYLLCASFVFLLHLVIAAVAKPSLALTMYGDATPCALLLLAFLAARENSRGAPGILPVFWKVLGGGLGLLLCSQAYWFQYDWRRQYSAPSPVIGDSLFLLAQVFYLSALALRPHSISAGRDLRTRSLDFVLLCVWWLSLYGFFGLPWQFVARDFSHYNPAFYFLALLQHLVIIVALGVLSIRKTAAWRSFYLQLMLAFILVAGGNLLLNIAIDRGTYYAGSYYDTPFLLGLFMFTIVAAYGASLRPQEDSTPNRELTQSLWTARFAMFGILSLPLTALLALFERDLPAGVETFRLRLVFGATFVLGALVYWKLSLLTRQLVHLVQLTHDSVENLKSVQRQVTHSEKLVALGRLASGAAHEISNPLTAILGYSELLSDIPSLTSEDRESALVIRHEVHRAQRAVSSLRDKLRNGTPRSAPPVDKNPVS
jgi:hypothetical protein